MELDVEKRKSGRLSDSPPDSTPVVCSNSVCVCVCLARLCTLQTRQLVAGVMERARLLLSVTIATDHTPSLLSYTSTEEEKGIDTNHKI